MAKGGSKMKVIVSGLLVIMLLTGLGMAGIGCVLEEEIKTGNIEVRVTDVQTEEEVSDTPTQFEITSIIATVSKVRICQTVVGQGTQQEQEEGVEQGEWINLNITGANPFDLLKLAGLERVLALAEVEAGYYSQISMTIDRLDVTINDGSEMVIIPDKPFEFIVTFSVVADKTTTVIFDFDVDKSVVIEEDKAIIKPIAEITMNIRYEESESE
jgi:hypothetical protein